MLRAKSHCWKELIIKYSITGCWLTVATLHIHPHTPTQNFFGFLFSFQSISYFFANPLISIPVLRHQAIYSIAFFQVVTVSKSVIFFYSVCSSISSNHNKHFVATFCLPHLGNSKQQARQPLDNFILAVVISMFGKNSYPYIINNGEVEKVLLYNIRVYNKHEPRQTNDANRHTDTRTHTEVQYNTNNWSYWLLQRKKRNKKKWLKR